MNALILSAVLGVIMMFSGILLKQKSAVRGVAITGLAVLLLVNILELRGISFFKIDVSGMMYFDRFALLFVSIALFSTLGYFILSAKDMEKVGVDYAEYFALIFFILSGVVLVASFKSLLILFLGIEIISIPLYILTGADKKNLKSNEAALKYFLMGSFSTGLMLMGITLIYGAAGNFGLEPMAAVPGVSSIKAPFLEIGGLLLLFVSLC